MITEECIEELFKTKTYEKVNIENVVKDKLNEYYKEKMNEEGMAVPHYSNWNSERKIRKPFIKIPSSSFQREIMSHIIAEENKKNGIAGYDILHQKEIRRKFYEKNLCYDDVEDKLKFYYDLLSETIMKSWEFLLYDLKIAMIYEEKMKDNNEVSIEYEEYVREDKRENNPFYIIDEEGYDILKGGTKGNYKKRFIEVAEKRIKEQENVYPIEFNYRIVDKKLVLKQHYIRIQLAMIYNQLLKNIYNDTSLKNEDSKLYNYSNLCNTIKSIYPKAIKDDIIKEEYVYIIEKISGINLAICFSEYYSRIMEKVKSELKDEIKLVLIAILKEFVNMPNIFTRSQIVKEMMEPVLFWSRNEEETLKNLYIVGNTVSEIRENYNKDWNSIYDLLKNEDLKKQWYQFSRFIHNPNNKSMQDIRYPFIFVKNNCLNYKEEYFRLCSRKVIKSLLYHKK